MIAADGEILLAAVDAAPDHRWTGAAPGGGDSPAGLGRAVHRCGGPVHVREVKDMPSPAGLISSPYDTDARYSTKRDVRMGGLSSAPDRDVRGGSSAPDRQRRDDARDDTGRSHDQGGP